MPEPINSLYDYNFMVLYQCEPCLYRFVLGYYYGSYLLKKKDNVIYIL